MERQKRTAMQLADMIAERLGHAFVNVHPDPACGWHPTVFRAPANAVALQQRAEEIASELRTTFDLKT